MRPFDDTPAGSEADAALLAIDATLDGRPVDPEFAELAELALLLRQEAPRPDQPFAGALDARVARRFAAPPGRRPATRGRRLRWLAPGAAVVAALAVAIVIVAGAGSGGPSPLRAGAAAPRSATSASSHGAITTAGPSGPSSAATSSAATSPSASSTATTPLAPAAKSPSPPVSGNAAGIAQSSATFGAASSAPSTAAPAPVDTGHRDIVQSAQIQLQASPKRIDAVAQLVFDVVGSQDGVVESSSVTATGTAAGSATFQLSVPSANLQATMTALSELDGARVLSRTDATTDITGETGGAGMKLAQARALRQSLLKQLAAATTTAQLDSLKLQLDGADASVSSDLATLRKLQHQVADSQIQVSIQAGALILAPAAGGGFTIGRAAHDAGRVLVVVAGVALIALAVLLPAGLVIALLAWLGLALRRHRRQQALDLL